MSAIRCLGVLLGVNQDQLAVLNVKSRNPNKFIVSFTEDDKYFIKLCSHDELQRTLDANQLAPEQTLNVVDSIPSQLDGHRWVVWPKLAMDGFDAVVCERDLEVAWLRFKDCVYLLAGFHSKATHIHGDCKLENIMFDHAGRPWFIDLECFEGDRGLAQSECLGTPAFAAPECWLERERCTCCEYGVLDQTTDMYSLAASFLTRFNIKPAAGMALQLGHSLCGEYHSCPAANQSVLSQAFERSKILYPPQWEARLNWLLQLCNPDAVGRFSSAQAIKALKLIQ
jgi:serine/threonine protein kinase